MSLVDFFFNANYRESLQKNNFVFVEETKVTESQKQRNNAKFWRNYHLKCMQEAVDNLNSEIMYDFIDLKDVTEDKFIIFLKRRGAKEWTFKVLWNRFLKTHNIN